MPARGIIKLLPMTLKLRSKMSSISVVRVMVASGIRAECSQSGGGVETWPVSVEPKLESNRFPVMTPDVKT